MSGYASDGGLIMPASIPLVDRATLELWRPLGFAGVAAAVLGLFIAEAEVPRDTLVGLLARACARFDVPEVIPVVAVPRATEGAAPMFIAEMWHGPTLAFKDIGMQVIGGLLDHFLRASGKHVSLVVRGWRACVAPPPPRDVLLRRWARAATPGALPLRQCVDRPMCAAAAHGARRRRTHGVIRARRWTSSCCCQRRYARRCSGCR